MRYKYIISVLLIIAINLLGNVNGQVKTKIFKDSIPSDFILLKSKIKKEHFVKSPDGFEKIISQASQDEKNIEYKNKFAMYEKVDIDVIKLADVTEDTKGKTYSVTLKAENALNISIQFNEFILSPNSILSIYSHNELTDSITAKENNKNNIWATRVYQGNTLNIVLKVPHIESGKSRLKIDKVNFGYKKFGAEYFGNPAASATCNINAVCPLGNGWDNEKNSVALIVSGGITSCTGALIMNSCNTNTPYVLTANHCLDGSVANWVFQFQYLSTSCTGNNGMSEDVQFNGCTLRANEINSDFALVELNQIPQPGSGLFYSGWQIVNSGNTATTIHHPKGDVMKISQDIHPLVAVAWNGGGFDHWRATFDQGIVQHGSSGAPLYDGNHRIIGQLHGDQNNNICGPDASNNCWCVTLQPPIGEYGRFDISWGGGGTNATRLSNWLDPSNSGAVAMNTTNVSNLIPSQASGLIISGSNNFCTGTAQYTLNVPAGTNVSWQSSNSNIANVSSTGNPATVTAIMDGAVNITATITVCNTNMSVTKKLVIGAPIISGDYTYTDYPYGSPMGLVEAPEDNEVCYTSAPTEMNTAMDISGATSVVWEKNSSTPSTLLWDQIGDDLLVTFRALNQTGSFKITASNGCSSVSKDYIFTTVSCSFLFSVSPNPTTGSVQVSSIDKKTTIKEIMVTDKTGSIKKDITYSNKITSALIDISLLPPDIYYIQIFDGKNWTSKAISKK